MAAGTLLQSTQEFLASKTSTALSFLAAGVGVASIAGLASLGAALLSIVWLSLQIFNYITFTYPKNVREQRERYLEQEREERAREVASGNSVCPTRQ